ncbi:hypothetical protein F5B22DRAFT_30197 [Xylaria bambusicola]|uniref:uncharacterized protein n=1 Tax=Xylaria bambusicola TaxID=326684 RepID=UPI0020081057|nr:uncharacterized protein F5B22DRAFT_30197 [Xylaria bambusicola]KAI0528293.1 hypothetical protein F5B22DRAFT_30197 [Xylaria bambusicola]
MKDNARAASLLEQLKNLLPMAKKASSELAEYQRKHGTTYESGVPGPNNAMLAASEEVLRQIAHAIRPYSHSETAAMRKEKRRVSPVVERSSQSGSWAPPNEPEGLATDSAEYSPRRRQNRVSFKTSDNAMNLHIVDGSLKTTHDNDLTPKTSTPGLQPPSDKPPIVGSNRASYTSELDTGGPSFGKDKQIEADEAIQGSVVSSLLYEVRPKPRREDYILEVPDPTKPRVHPRIRRSHGVFCVICNEAHSPDKCPERNKRASSSKTIRNTGEISPMPGISARTSREDTRYSPAEQANYSIPVPTESEASGQSDRDADNPRWSRTSLPLPSSKSSSPSTQGNRSPTAKRRISKTVRAADVQNELRETRDFKKEKEKAEKRQTWAPQGLRKSEKDRELGQAQQHDDSAQGSGQRSDERPKEEQRQQPVFKAYRPGVMEGRDVSSVEAPPVPETPSEVPSRGQSGRRRPRRPRPNTMML